jgi:hypothetical protein
MFPGSANPETELLHIPDPDSDGAVEHEPVGGRHCCQQRVDHLRPRRMADRHSRRRYGRVRMLQITIVWYAFFTAASGLTNLFGQMLIMRSLQGFSFGGEWTAGPVLVGEIVRAQHRGKAVGILSTSTRLCRLMVCTAG